MNEESDHPTALRVEKLDLAYGDYEVLRDVSFEVRDGRCLGVMGGSGCGKSTLLKSLIGLLAPTSGRVFFHSDDLWASDSKKRLDILRRLGVLFQGGALWSSMNLLEAKTAEKRHEELQHLCQQLGVNYILIQIL